MPFTTDQFLRVLVDYNDSVFPAQIILIGAAAAAFMLVLRPFGDSNRIVSMVLVLLWLWTGIVYHIIFFSETNPAGWLFGILFIVNAVLIFNEGVLNERLKFNFSSNLSGIAGTFFVIFSLLIYPTIGFLLGREFPANPTFGTPCPTTVYTFGMLMLAGKRLPVRLIWIPLFWSAFGISAALSMGITEDLVLPVAGLVLAALVWHGRMATKEAL